MEDSEAPRNLERRLTTVEVTQDNMFQSLVILAAEMKALTHTVAEISQSLKLFRWLFALAVAAGPGIGILLVKLLE